MKRILDYLLSVGFKDTGFTWGKYINMKRVISESEDWVKIEKTCKGYECECHIWLNSSFGKKMKTIPISTYGEVIAFLKRNLR